MKLYRAFFAFFILVACTQSGLRPSNGGVGSNGVNGIQEASSASSSFSSSSTQNIVSSEGATMYYAYPPVAPSRPTNTMYYNTYYADQTIQNQNLDFLQNNPPEAVKLQGASGTADPSDGSWYCSSNQLTLNSSQCSLLATAPDGINCNSLPNSVECVRPPSNILSEIESLQQSPTGYNPVFINGAQFYFKSYAANAIGMSAAYFDGATVTKAPISFNPSSGALVSPNTTTYTYGNGCNLGSSGSDGTYYTVGFSPVNTASNYATQFYLSGIWAMERPATYLLNETVTQPTSVTNYYNADACTDGTTNSSGQPNEWPCNLFADRVSVWSTFLLPVLYTNGSMSAYNFPGSPTSGVQDQSDFGRYPASGVTTTGGVADEVGISSGGTVVTTSSDTTQIHMLMTPKLGIDADITGNTPDPNAFIVGICLSGKRIINTGVGLQTRPLIQALRYELRAPSEHRCTVGAQNVVTCQ